MAAPKPPTSLLQISAVQRKAEARRIRYSDRALDEIRAPAFNRWKRRAARAHAAALRNPSPREDTGMTTRRDFLKLAGGAAGIVFCGCTLRDAARAQQPGEARLPVMVNGKRVKTID